MFPKIFLIQKEDVWGEWCVLLLPI